jgi:hypothetical protein
MTVEELARRLERLGYEELFMRLDDHEMNAIWNEPGAAETLQSLAADNTRDAGPRFLAAEILFLKQPGYPPDAIRDSLAAVYAEALRHTEWGNAWGLPGDADGQAGQHLLRIGRPAGEALAGLLDDARPVRYAGSSEATFGNSFQYRIKDLAAFFLGRTWGLPYAVLPTAAERDVEIGKLRAASGGEYPGRRVE